MKSGRVLPFSCQRWQAVPATLTPRPAMVRFATFNLAFDRTAPGMLGEELALTRTEQDALLARLAEGSLSGAIISRRRCCGDFA